MIPCEAMDNKTHPRVCPGSQDSTKNFTPRKGPDAKDIIRVHQKSGLHHFTALTDTTYGYPNPAVKGEKLVFSLEGIWHGFPGGAMDRVIFYFYQGGKLVTSLTFHCGEWQEACPEPVWERTDPYTKWQITRAKFEFATAPVPPSASDYDLHIVGVTKREGDEPLW